MDEIFGEVGPQELTASEDVDVDLVLHGDTELL
jgi:hypothetical protein